MAFKMKGSPAKRGEIQGTESVSALKAKKWIAKQIGKNLPKIGGWLDDAWVGARDAVFGGGKAASKTAKTGKPTNKPDFKLLDTKTGEGKLGTMTKVETYQDIANPGRLHQIKYSDQGLGSYYKGGKHFRGYKPFVGEGEKLLKKMEWAGVKPPLKP